MMISRRALLAGSAAIVAGAAHGCGFDGALDAGFGYVHPRAMDVALAVRQAVGDGLLDVDALAPLAPGADGLWRATEQLRLFGQALSASSAPGRPPLALLLAEASLWTRYAADDRIYECRVHASGPAAGDATLVSDRAVLAAINSGRLRCADALAHSLIVIDAPDARVASDFLSTVAPAGTSALAARAAWSRAR